MTPDDTPTSEARAIFDAWARRRQEGTGELFQDLVARHPEHATTLHRLLGEHEGIAKVLDRLASSGGGGSGPRLMEGRRLGDFKIRREIGRGGMGIVFEAEQLSLHRRVALKILPAQLTLHEVALERFKREAEITGRLHHKGIVEIHQVGEEEGIHFISMELVEGTSLDRIIDRMHDESFYDVRKKKIGDVVSVHGLGDAPTRRPDSGAGTPERSDSGSKKGSSSASNKNYIETSIKLACQVADALEHAHAAGVIHRDVKPSNILVRADGSAVLTDFGLAREQGLPAISATGDFAGTPYYVSPEQAMSGRLPVDHRSDVFSLGATLYELVTLQKAFPGENSHEVLTGIISRQPEDPQKHNPALAPDLATILYKALEKDPDRRYASAKEFADDLRAFIEYRPIRAKRTPTVVKAWRWMRREPFKAGMIAVLAAGIPVMVALSAAYWTERRVSAERERMLQTAELPARIERSYLLLGVGQLEESEKAFDEILAQDPASSEAAAGLAMALLALERPADAIAVLDRPQAKTPLRLRIEALRAANRHVDAQELESKVTKSESPLELYLDAILLIHDRPFVIGAPTRGHFVSRASGSTACVASPEPEPEDSILRYRERARRSIQLLLDALAREDRTLYRFAICWAAWVARDAETARRYSVSLAEDHADSPVAWCYVGCAREVFDSAGAIAAFERALELDPDLSLAAERLSVLLRRNGEAARAVDVLLATAPGRVQSASFLANLAESLILAGRTEEGLLYADRAVAEDDSLVLAHDARGAALYYLGRREEARDALKRALILEPDAARLHIDLGWILFDLSDHQGAVEHLEQALRLDPGNPFAAYNLGVVHKRQGRAESDPDIRREILEEAVELHRNAIAFAQGANHSSFPIDMAYASLGNCYEFLQDSEAAIQPYQRARELAPHVANHAISLGSALLTTGRIPQSMVELQAGLDLMRQSAERDRDLVEAGYDRLLRANRALGDIQGALSVCREWTEDLPESSRAWNERAWIQVDPDRPEGFGDAADALAAAERARELTSARDPAVLDTYARALAVNGRHEDALAVARDARGMLGVESDPRLAWALDATIEAIESATKN